MAFDIEEYNASEFWRREPELKELWVDIYDEMTVHTQGNTPSRLLETRRPNEDYNVYEYRKTIYQPITKGPINRSIHKLFRIFQNANHSIKTTDSLREFIESPVFQEMSFSEFMHGRVTKRMIEDPNGFLSWLPGGAGLFTNTEKVDVVPHLILSKRIQTKTDEVLTWTEDDGDSPDVFFSLTRDGFYSHTKQKNGMYRLELIYMHNIGMIPAVILGGTPTDDGILESYFAPFVPFGNEAIRQFSDAQAVNVTSAFPYRTEQYTMCDYPSCEGRGWYYPDDCDDCEATVCPRCSGSGHMPHNSPYGTFVRPEPQVGQEPNTAPMIEFTSPATDILEHVDNSWRNLLKDARHAIFDDWIEEAQSGVAKIVDREDLDAFLTNISNNIYDNLILKSLVILQGYRDINGKEPPIVMKPSQFRIKTEQDLVNELGVLIEKKAPAPFILETIKDLTKKRFSNDKKTSQVMEFLMVYDPLFALSNEEKALVSASGAVTQRDLAKNVSAYRILNELLLKDPELFEKGYDRVAQMVEEKIVVEPPLFGDDG